MSRLRLIAVVLLSVIGAGSLLHVGRAWVSPLENPGREAAQVRHLAHALDSGAGPRMQALFPEGEFFTWVLTGLAAGRLAEQGQDVDQNMAVVLAAVQATGRDHVAAAFGSGHRGVDHGAFYHGWRLLLLVQQARVTGDEGHRALVHQEATRLLAALDVPGEPLTSYPGQAWPCDLVVGWAAVHQADELLPITGLSEATGRLLDDIDTWRDPATGRIGHRFNPDGTVEGARGSSQAVINTYLRDISPGLADSEWAGFIQQFVQGSLGLVGVREYPVGDDSAGDVDSGPLVNGISLSASAVGLGAARANSDLALASRLNSEAELLGAPLPWRGTSALNGRAFAFGLMPVGDAFVVAARTQPVGITTASVNPEHPAVWWPVWFALAALPAIIGGALWLRGGRRAATPR